MPVHILRPNANGSTTNWTAVGTANVFDAVDPGDPINHNDDTTYATGDFGPGPYPAGSHHFKFGSMPGEATGVRSLRTFVRWSTGGSPNPVTRKLDVRWSLDGGFGTQETDTRSAPFSYTDVEFPLATRPGGGKWTLADLANSTLFLECSIPEDILQTLSRQTSVWAEIEYDTSPFDLDAYREVVGRQTRLLKNTPETYQVIVPYDYLGLDVMDEVGLAHDSIGRAATILDSIQNHQLIDVWRRMYTQILDITDNMDNMTMTITLLNMEPYICNIWDTGASPFDVNNDASLTEIAQRRRGIALINAGAGRTENRSDLAFIVDSSARSNYIRLASVIDGVAKSNNLGTLFENAIGNDVLNSCFINGTTGWTLTTSTGSIATSTDEQLFENISDYSQQVLKVTKGSGDTYFDRTFTTTATNRRILIWSKATSASLIGGWGFQRDDNDWWNDSTKTWSSALTLNTLQTSNNEWTRTISKVITDQGAGTGKIRIGYNSGALNAIMYAGQIMSYEDTIIYSDVIANNTKVIVGGLADTFFDEINVAGDGSRRQVCHPDRGTLRFTLRAYQDGPDAIEEGVENRHALFMFRWNADNARDEVSLEKVNGQLRIAARRFIADTGTAEDALAYKNFTLAEGAESEIAYRWTSPNDGELGLAARTLSVFVNGVKGTDDQATNVHSSNVEITQLYVGSVPTGTIAIKNAANYLRNWEVVQRVIPDEEILGRRPPLKELQINVFETIATEDLSDDVLPNFDIFENISVVENSILVLSPLIDAFDTVSVADSATLTLV